MRWVPELRHKGQCSELFRIILENSAGLYIQNSVSENAWYVFMHNPGSEDRNEASYTMENSFIGSELQLVLLWAGTCDFIYSALITTHYKCPISNVKFPLCGKTITLKLHLEVWCWWTLNTGTLEEGVFERDFDEGCSVTFERNNLKRNCRVNVYYLLGAVLSTWYSLIIHLLTMILWSSFYCLHFTDEED